MTIKGFTRKPFLLKQQCLTLITIKIKNFFSVCTCMWAFFHLWPWTEGTNPAPVEKLRGRESVDWDTPSV